MPLSRTVGVFSVAITLTFGIFSVALANADANLMCSPYIDQCPCNQVLNPNAGKPGEPKCIVDNNAPKNSQKKYSNTHACGVGVCTYTENGTVAVEGICVAKNDCKAVMCDGKPCPSSNGAPQYNKDGTQICFSGGSCYPTTPPASAAQTPVAPSATQFDTWGNVQEYKIGSQPGAAMPTPALPQTPSDLIQQAFNGGLNTPLSGSPASAVNKDLNDVVGNPQVPNPNTGDKEESVFDKGAPSIEKSVTGFGLNQQTPPAQQSGGWWNSAKEVAVEAWGGVTNAAGNVASAIEEKMPSVQEGVSTALGCTVGYFFGGCDSAKAGQEKTDAEVIAANARANAEQNPTAQQPNITTLPVASNAANAPAVPASVFSTQPESAQQGGPLAGSTGNLTPANNATVPTIAQQPAQNPPITNTSPSVPTNPVETGAPAPAAGAQITPSVAPVADMDKMSPEQLKAIEKEMSDARSRLAAEQEKAAAPPAKAPSILSGAWDWITTGDNSSFKEAVGNASRAVPVVPVDTAELPAIPGAEPKPAIVTTSLEANTPAVSGELSASQRQPLSDTEITARIPAPEALPQQTFDPKVQEVFDQKIKDAQGQVQYAQDLLARSESPAARSVAQMLLDDSNKRLNAIVDNSISYSAGNPSPALQTAIQQASQGQGALSSAFDTGAKWGSDVAKDLGSTINLTNMGVSDVARGAGWVAAETVGTVSSAIGNLGGKIGLPGFNPDAQTAIGNAIDPYGSEYRTAADVAVIAPFGISPIKSLGGSIEDAVFGGTVGATSRSAVTDVVVADTRAVFQDSAGFPLAGGARIEPSFEVAGAVARTETITEVGTDLTAARAGTLAEENVIARTNAVTENLNNIIGRPAPAEEAPVTAGNLPKISGDINPTIVPQAVNDNSTGLPRVSSFNSSVAEVDQLAANSKTPATASKIDAAMAEFDAAANRVKEAANSPVTPATTGNIDTAMADFNRASDNLKAAAEPNLPVPATNLVERSVTAPAAENSIWSGVTSDFSAGPKALEPGVEKLSMRDLAGGTAITGGILCLGFCPSSTPIPQEPIPAEVLSLSKEDIALLFPKQSGPPEPTETPVAPPAQTVVTEEPQPVQPTPPAVSQTPPAVVEQTPPQVAAAPQSTVQPTAPAEQPAASPPAPSELIITTASPSMPATPSPLPEPALTTPSPSKDIVPPQETPEFRERVVAEQKAVEEQVQAARDANKAESAAFEAQKMENQQKLNDAIARAQANLEELQRQNEARIAEQARLEELNRSTLLGVANKPGATDVEESNPLAQPLMTPAPIVTAGVGPTAEEIAKGLRGSAAAPGDVSGSQKVTIPIQFNDNSALPTQEGSAAINNLGEAASREKFKGYTFTIEGYTDPRTPSAAWGYDNVRLSQARAEAVRQTIATFYDIPLQNITAIGMGSANPILTGSGAIDNAASRRVVVTATPPR